MKVKYIYSACIEIDCGGVKILTDPWFTDGIYDGAWYQFPKIDPFEYISKPDLIYISHIHPDHYDPIFLKKLFERFGEIEIVIPDLTPNYLFLKGKLDGIRLTPTRQFKNAQIELFIEENDTGSISDIDSALIVKDLSSNKTLLNLNDCIYNQKHVDKLKEIISTIGGKVDFMAVGYTGAGPYPQTYIDPEKEKDLLISEAENKKQEFFKRYKQYVDFFASEINLPFAGEYILGGRLHYLNEYRGVADAFEIKGIDDKAIILSSGGEIDIITKTISAERHMLHKNEDLIKRIDEIKNNKLDYEKEIQLDFEKINFMRLLKSSVARAGSKSEIEGNYHFIFSISDSSAKIVQRFLVETLNNSVTEIPNDEKIELEEYSEIIIDYRYFYGLLTTIYHWNNAEVGSQYLTKRVPLSDCKPSVQHYLNFLTIC